MTSGTRRGRTLLANIVASLVLATGPSTSQEPTPRAEFAATRARLTEDAIAKLQAEDLATAAWGAYAAAEFRLTKAVPELRKRLATISHRIDDAGTATALAILDALIQNDARVPSAELAPFLRRWTTESVVALAAPHAEDHEGLLLAAYRQLGPGRDSGRACGNLLAAMRAEVFLHELLTAPMVLHIGAHDGAGDEDLDAVVGITVSCSRTTTPRGFPLPTRYTLDDGPTFRAIRRTADTSECDVYLEGTTRTAQNGWVRSYLGKDAEGVTFDLMPRTWLRWTDEAGLRAHVAQQRTALTAGHAAVVAAAVRAKLVAADSIPTPPKITVSLDDYRSDPKQRLPESADWELRTW